MSVSGHLVRYPVPGPNTVILQHGSASTAPRWLAFVSPYRIIRVQRLDEVLPALWEIDRAVEAGAFAAGFLTYEASPAFDAALVTRAPGPLPLLWFGLYDRVEECATLPYPTDTAPLALDWAPSISRDEYHRAFERIKAYIASGDTYQVNYTLRLRAPFAGEPWPLFQALCRAQQVSHAAYVDIGDHALCSASPELFFSQCGSSLTCRPMKGTAPRGLNTAGDAAQVRTLHASIKDRAENVMIVDMIRNDLGRIARPGTVQVPRLYDIERYATLFQMTSTVTAETNAALPDMLRALFPCASITGAPKVRTMQIIAELEDAPRGIYTGSIGFVAPNRTAAFQVAIRTVHVDRTAQQAEYGTGGGIVWDSREEREYDECRTKALVLTAPQTPFKLLETLRWQPRDGYYLLRRHLRRLAESARYFDIPLDVPAVERALHDAASGFPHGRRRVRLLVDQQGRFTLEHAPLTVSVRPWRVAIPRRPVDAQDRYLYHKTTRREVYEQARADCPGYDDVLLWNARGEVTESTICNLVLRCGEALLTPPVHCGLLPGTMRAHLLARHRLTERVVTLDDLAHADALYLINSVRGWIPVELNREDIVRLMPATADQRRSSRECPVEG